ncbi:beta-1,6-N-acetylglucosaminyltransferase [Falsiroseomonas sp. HW251]|uniref:beta-1,6-N-acetylglucosaminyltransferase n=1 Tax=Falsiroseomonas sp. HW251 TaxID=3390998 RepID=UPI003D31EAA3
MLVIAHANPGVFRRLAEALRHPAIRLFVHLDARVDEQPFRGPGQDHVTFLTDRQANHWASFTQVEVALRLFRAARAAGLFRSFALISGDSLPLVANEVLLAALGATPTVMQRSLLQPGHRFFRRLRDVYIPHTTIGLLRGHQTFLDRTLEDQDVEEAIRAIRTRPLKQAFPYPFYKGSQWMALSDADLGAILGFLDAHPDYVEVFRYSLMPDEHFFQTAQMHLQPGFRGPDGIMGADWSRQPLPFVFTDPAELPRVTQSGWLFYRKFSDAGLAMVDAVLAARRDAAAVRDSGAGIARELLERAVK